MTVTPQGYPDWLQPQPTSVVPLLNMDYAPGGASFLFPAIRTVGFNTLYIQWTNNSSSAADCYLIIQQDNGVVNAFKVLFTRFATAKIGSSVLIAVPVIAGVCTLEAQGVIGGLIQGAITVVGANGGVKHNAQLGTYPLHQDTPRALAAGANASVFPQFVIEGPASLSMNGQIAGVVISVYALDFDGQYKFVTQAISQGVNVPITVDFWCPPRQLRIDYANGTAGAVNLYNSLVVGG